MSSILKVDQIQLSNGTTPTAGDLGIGLNKSDIPSGGIINVWKAKGTNSRYTVTSTSWIEADTALRVTLTPASASSKLFIITQHHIQQDYTTLSSIVPAVEVGGTAVAIYEEQDSGGGAIAANILTNNSSMSEQYRMSGSGNIWWPATTHGLYECTSTSQHTVKVYHKIAGGGQLIGDNGPAPQLIVFEIAG